MAQSPSPTPLEVLPFPRTSQTGAPGQAWVGQGSNVLQFILHLPNGRAIIHQLVRTFGKYKLNIKDDRYLVELLIFLYEFSEWTDKGYPNPPGGYALHMQPAPIPQPASGKRRRRRSVDESELGQGENLNSEFDAKMRAMIEALGGPAKVKQTLRGILKALSNIITMPFDYKNKTDTDAEGTEQVEQHRRKRKSVRKAAKMRPNLTRKDAGTGIFGLP
ncbi:hypothetical protein WR25_21802 [Diploscapter pachys]|uniref:Uncharacterized protein n=1 Tax=Diploscapter pachys TaxID=2018661 RepID=A0A2A2L7H0_9BILA|nr:hypothetical protein WR25_21802 [Diploscapter pachys]